jgi:acetyl esterase
MKRTSSYLQFLVIIFLVFSTKVLAVHPVTITKDIVWAEPRGFKLTTDIYVPETDVKNLPVLIIYHGGGWLINTKAIMNDMSYYMAANADLIVVNMNYRLLGDINNTTTTNEIVEDALGAVLWVKDNIKSYGGDPKKIAVTGDSAGGHLAAMVMLAGRSLESDGFAGDTLGFKPTYLPRNKTARQIASSDGAKVQAVVLSYAAFDLYAAAKNGFESSQNIFWKLANAAPRGMFGVGINVDSHPHFYKAVSPINYVADIKNYKLPPQFVFVGSLDKATTPESITQYVDLLKQHNQSVEFKIYEGKKHAFLDSGCSEHTGGCFNDLAVPVLKDVIQFLNKTFL